MSPSVPTQRVEELASLASRQWAKGRHKRALAALREACFLASEDARLWALYGARLANLGRLDEAMQAIGQAIYFRKAAHDEARVRSTRRVLERLRVAA